MNISGFYLDDNIVYKDNTISYNSKDTEDDYIEIITPSNCDNVKVVTYYKLCERVETQVYTDLDTKDSALEEYINASIKSIYDI